MLHRSCLTFDMSGGPKGAKRPLARPLDGGVRRRAHCGYACQCPGRETQASLFRSVTEYVGSGRPPSAKQPPAIPIFSGRIDTNQKRVVPQTAQKCRSWS